MSVSAIFTRLDKAISLAAAIAASLFMTVAVAAGFWQVLSRFIFATPSMWSEALVRVSLTWMVMIGLGVALRQGALVSIDIVESGTRGIVRQIVRVAILTANLTLLAVLVWVGTLTAERVQLQEMAGLEVSMTWGYAAIPVGCFFGIVGTIAHFFDRQSSELENTV